jgi:hypothetical protein
MEQPRTEKRCGSKNYCGDVYAEGSCGAAVFLGIAQRIARLSRSPERVPHRNNFRYSPLNIRHRERHRQPMEQKEAESGWVQQRLAWRCVHWQTI